MAQEMLGHSGFRVITASHGLEALEVFSKRQDEISLVILAHHAGNEWLGDHGGTSGRCGRISPQSSPAAMTRQRSWKGNMRRFPRHSCINPIS